MIWKQWSTLNELISKLNNSTYHFRISSAVTACIDFKLESMPLIQLKSASKHSNSPVQFAHDKPNRSLRKYCISTRTSHNQASTQILFSVGDVPTFVGGITTMKKNTYRGATSSHLLIFQHGCCDCVTTSANQPERQCRRGWRRQWFWWWVSNLPMGKCTFLIL